MSFAFLRVFRDPVFVSFVLLPILACGSRDTWEKQAPAVQEERLRSAAEVLAVDHIPTFEEYPVKKVFEGTPAPVNLFSHHNARRLRDRLVEPAKAGPNFAGHFTVITWRSESGTQQTAMVDAQTGLIHLPSLLASHLESEFRLHSRLFIANPPRAGSDSLAAGGRTNGYKTIYYLWAYNTLVPIYTLPH